MPEHQSKSGADMGKTLTCPTCGSWLLETRLGHTDRRCPTCNRVFVPGSEVRRSLLQTVEDVAALQAAVPCPACETPMKTGRLMEAELMYCPACWASWLPEAPTAQPERSESIGLGRAMLYGLSLPERALRSTIGTAAGVVKGTAALLIPQCFQNSKTYEIVVKNSLRLLTEDLGGVQGSTPGDQPAVENYVARKTVGNFIDLAGIASLHLSPLWLLAVVSDVAYGAKEYAIELGDELKRQGLIGENSTIEKIDDILEAVRKSSGSAAGLFDTPPLNADDLKKALNETKASLKEADVTSLLPQSEIARYWADMKELSRKENVSLLGLSGAVTLHTLNRIGEVAQGALTGVWVAGGMLHRNILGHYTGALDEYRQRGFYTALREDSTPYIDAVWNNFSLDRNTWTEEVVTGRAIAGLFKKIAGLFHRSWKEEGTTSEPAP